MLEKIEQVKEVLQSAHQETESFGLKTTLHCLSGCGQCCENPLIEVTVLEMLPLAKFLIETNKADEILNKIKDRTDGICVIFEPHAEKTHQGRCGVYAYRPLICRLFGFSARRSKEGKAQLVTCQNIKIDQAQTVRMIEEKFADQSLTAPMVTDFGMRLLSIDPDLAKETFPINVALQRAIEMWGLYQQCRGES